MLLEDDAFGKRKTPMARLSIRIDLGDGHRIGPGKVRLLEAIAEHGLRDAVARDPSLARGVNVLEGKITYEAVAEAHGLDYSPLEDVLPLAPV
jgi:hypothetical protein